MAPQEIEALKPDFRSFVVDRRRLQLGGSPAGQAYVAGFAQLGQAPVGHCLAAPAEDLLLVARLPLFASPLAGGIHTLAAGFRLDRTPVTHHTT